MAINNNNYVFKVQRTKPEPVKTTETVPAPKLKNALHDLRQKLRDEKAL